MKWIILIVLVFIIGVLTPFAFNLDYNNLQNPLGNEINEKDSPSDWISEDNIEVYNNEVIIKLDNPQWAKFTNTNSMDPVFDSEANTIEIKPKSKNEIKQGDIISYNSKIFDKIIVHRVIKISSDDNGWYILLKGDNNKEIDPERVRFNQIQGVVVAVIY